LVFIPRPRYPAFPSVPLFLQLESGCAATIQFPPGISGEAPCGGSFPTCQEFPPKHAAIPIAPVIVGVTYSRKKFAVLEVPSSPPAFGELLPQVFS